MDTHCTPVPTQWEGRWCLDRTHEHMAPEHATDTNEPKTDTLSYKHGFSDTCAKFLKNSKYANLGSAILVFSSSCCFEFSVFSFPKTQQGTTKTENLGVGWVLGWMVGS